jgi:hypothetical protein
LLTVVNLGLSPFLHWHQRLPDVPLFSYAVTLFGVFSLLFLLNLNRVLRRLAALLPDETLRAETALFTALNRGLLLSLPLLVGGFALLARSGRLPAAVERVIHLAGPLQFWLVLLLALLPVAITLSLIWKIKEALLESVFSPPA